MKTRDGHRYALIDDALTWNESRTACEKRHGVLAMANDAATFTVLRRMYEQYSVGAERPALGAWLDGRRVNDTADSWQCESNKIDCPSNMPWSSGEPNRQQTEHCVLVWYSRTDGVANYGCARKMVAICEMR